MIKGLALLFLLTLPLISGSVINQDIYEKENSVDVMLSFDTPYEGKIIQKKEGANTIFILDNATISEKTTKEINSPIVQTLTLTPLHKQLFIELVGFDPFEVDASKTVDNYGLRLRIKPVEELSTLAPLEEKAYETKKEDNITAAYLKVMLTLAGLIGILYLLKKWLANRNGDFQGNWLFDKSTQKNKSTIKIKHQHAIDMKNRVALISYGEKEYLILLGNTNLLLDTFDTKEDSFESVLSQNEDALDDFIQQKSKKFEAYKERL